MSKLRSCGLVLVVVVVVASARAAEASDTKTTITVTEGNVVVSGASGNSRALATGQGLEISAAGEILASSEVGEATPPRDWREEIQKKLDKEVSVTFLDTPLHNVLAGLRNSAKVNMILDARSPEVDPDKPITLNLTKVKLQSVLSWVARLAGLEYVIADEAIFLASPTRMSSVWRTQIVTREEALYHEALKGWTPRLQKSLSRPVTLNLTDKNGNEALDLLQALTAVNFVIDPQAESVKEPVTLTVTRMSLERALAWLTRQLDASYVLVDEAVFITTVEKANRIRLERARLEMQFRFKRLITLELEDQPLGAALEIAAKLANLKINLKGKVPPEARVTIAKTTLPVDRAVNLIMQQAEVPGFLIGYQGDTITIWLREQAPVIKLKSGTMRWGAGEAPPIEEPEAKPEKPAPEEPEQPIKRD